jgi:hypothetical protein
MRPAWSFPGNPRRDDRIAPGIRAFTDSRQRQELLDAGINGCLPAIAEPDLIPVTQNRPAAIATGDKQPFGSISADCSK